MGKTVTTYLIDGNPQGPRYVFISNKTCRMFIIPRANLNIINEREEFLKPAFYMLVGEDNDLKSEAYLGQTKNFRERIKDHNNKKAFWHTALVFIANDNTVNEADVRYLEYLALIAANQAKHYRLKENKQVPKDINLPEHQKSPMDEFFEDIKLLTSFSGCNIFELIEQKNNRLFYIKSRKCNARGFYDENGFTVLKKSILADSVTPSFGWQEKRQQLIHEYANMHEEKLVLQSDQTFSSPSTAAGFCLGRSVNGWTKWKDENGCSLDEVYRQQLK